MAKNKTIATVLKLQIPAGGANPSPPVGPALGQANVNIMDFCNAFNAETQNAEKGYSLFCILCFCIKGITKIHNVYICLT